MTQEVRSILFSPEESRVVVSEFLTAHAGGLRQVERIELEVVAGAARAVIHWGAGLDRRRIMDSAELLRAVLLYCKRMRIPLSSRSQKRVGVVGGCLALTASINLAAAAAKVSGDTISYVTAGPDLTALHSA